MMFKFYCSQKVWDKLRFCIIIFQKQHFFFCKHLLVFHYDVFELNLISNSYPYLFFFSPSAHPSEQVSGTSLVVSSCHCHLCKQTLLEIRHLQLRQSWYNHNAICNLYCGERKVRTLTVCSRLHAIRGGTLTEWKWVGRGWG